MKFCPWLLWSGLEQRAVLTVWALGRARVLQESLRAPCVVPWDRFGWLGRRHWAFPGGACGKEPTCQCESCGRCSFVPWVGKTPWRRAWQPTPVFLPGVSPWTEVPGGLQSVGSQSRTRLKHLSMHARRRHSDVRIRGSRQQAWTGIEIWEPPGNKRQ